MQKRYTEIERLRGYSSIFSRSAFSDVIEYNDFSRLNMIIDRYDSKKKQSFTYMDYIKYAYRVISKNYLCEYVYKNEIINKILIRKYCLEKTVAINEFRVCNSIADLALFNEESKVFEIKTEYDTSRRIVSQFENYSKFFQKCYIVVPEELYQKYDKCVSQNVGIIILSKEKGGITLTEERHAIDNEAIDINVLMHSILTSEYRNIVMRYYGFLPNVSCYDMFEECSKLISQIPQKELQMLYIDEIKKRKNNTAQLKSYQPEIRQLCLCLNLNEKKYNSLYQKLNNIIE